MNTDNFVIIVAPVVLPNGFRADLLQESSGFSGKTIMADLTDKLTQYLQDVSLPYLTDKLNTLNKPTVKTLPKPQSSHHLLSPREQEVLILVTKGLTQKEIARIMDLSPCTIGGYKKEIYRKLGVSNSAEATIEAIKMRLVDIDDL